MSAKLEEFVMSRFEYLQVMLACGMEGNGGEAQRLVEEGVELGVAAAPPYQDHRLPRRPTPYGKHQLVADDRHRQARYDVPSQ